jgi:hypothetical protein
MPDMLVRLYDLPDPRPYEERMASRGFRVRRMTPLDRYDVRAFVRANFNDRWAAEAEAAFSHGHPVTGFVAVRGGEIVGFAVYEATWRNFFGPTGMREDLRAKTGAGAVMLIRCLEAMREMGYGYAIIGGVGPAVFYERVCGASIIEGSDPGMYADLHREMRERGEP